jgi:DNA-binding MurR/RpiR family transcriptional regulator
MRRPDHNWETLKPQIEKGIAQGDGVHSLAWRYGVSIPTMVRVLKQLGLETFDQRFQRLTAARKRKKAQGTSS